MGQECFYRENRQDRAEEEILLTERLAEGCGETHWRIRPMTQRENEEIWKRCGEDEGRYQEMILAESVVFPDLKDAALQNSYGVIGAERQDCCWWGNMTACGERWSASTEGRMTDVPIIFKAERGAASAACDTCGD